MQKKNKKAPQACKCRKTALLASPGRFELPAYRLGGDHSIQLSYGDICKKYSILYIFGLEQSAA